MGAQSLGRFAEKLLTSSDNIFGLTQEETQSFRLQTQNLQGFYSMSKKNSFLGLKLSML